MKSDQPTSFKDRLNQEVLRTPKPSNDTHLDGNHIDGTHHIARDTGNTPTVLFISKTSKRSFAYSYLQNLGMDDESGDIDVNFTSGKIVIQGKNLDKLFMDLHRHKVADVNINTEDIDDITITLHED